MHFFLQYSNSSNCLLSQNYSYELLHDLLYRQFQLGVGGGEAEPPPPQI